MTFPRKICLGLLLLSSTGQAAEPVALKPGVRGLVVRASGPVKIDGKLDEWTQAFCTPVQYNHKDLANRPAQFFYLWDDEGFYVGLRCLDQKQANPAPLAGTYNGDAVEFYLDTRAGDALRSKDWTAGAIHFYYTAFDKAEIKPRWVMRRGIATSETPIEGVELAATRTADHYDLEFKIPWKNFPEFKPVPGALMALDAELCHGDGGTRTDRTFAYGSPLSVQQPASLGTVQLVGVFDPDYIPAVGPAMFPMWVDTPWVQQDRGMVQAVAAIPPGFVEISGEVNVRIHDADGRIIKTLPARVELFGPADLNFARAVATWSIDEHPPGSYFATAKVQARTGKTLATVVPRMVDEAIFSGR